MEQARGSAAKDPQQAISSESLDRTRKVPMRLPG
jgi:hypothetical protein